MSTIGVQARRREPNVTEASDDDGGFVEAFGPL